MAHHLTLAKKKLLPSNTDAGLPGRENQHEQLYLFLNERLKTNASSSRHKSNITGLQMNKTIFMCGVPGTGKTATLNSVIDRLNKEKKLKSSQLNSFEYAYINAQHLASADRMYPEIANKFLKERLSKDRSVAKLEKLFVKENGQITKNDTFYIVAIDELDLLCSERRNKHLYSLFDWPTSSSSKLILIAIANAMDLAERFRGRLTSRIGWDKVIFDSYSSDSLARIVEIRLGKKLQALAFEPNSLLLATKKIGRTTGDARRILDTCILAIDKAIEMKETIVTIKLISKIGFHNIDHDRLNFLKTCPPLNLMALQCIIRVGDDVGEENITSEDVYVRLLDNMNHLKVREFFGKFILEPRRFCVILDDLVASSIIYLEDNKPWPVRRLYIKDSSPVFRDYIRNESVVAKFFRYE